MVVEAGRFVIMEKSRHARLRTKTPWIQARKRAGFRPHPVVAPSGLNLLPVVWFWLWVGAGGDLHVDPAPQHGGDCARLRPPLHPHGGTGQIRARPGKQHPTKHPVTDPLVTSIIS